MVATPSLPLQIPLGISEFSATPPHKERVTSGRSLGESDKLSVPLSAATLPTDWGEWDTERRPTSTQCLGSCSGSLQGEKPHGTPMEFPAIGLLEKAAQNLR